MADVQAWPEGSQLAALVSMLNEVERCGGCGLTRDDGWWVAAVIDRCPTCEDLDRRRSEIPEKNREGMRVKFDHLHTPDESRLESSNAFYTMEGATERRRAKRERQKAAPAEG